MIHLPILRWGQRYESLETRPLLHFATGEVLAEVSQANAALVRRDLRGAAAARDALRGIPCAELLERCRRAATLFLEAELPVGAHDTQTPEQFVRCQSGSTGLPEHMCRANMAKIHHVGTRIEEILHALTRDLPLDMLARGFGEEHGVMRSYQANAAALGLVLPSNSPGVHALWLPVLPLQIGLVLKPGSQDPWTPHRMAEAFLAAGIPREAIGLYTGGPEIGAALLEHAPRTMVFGDAATVERHRGDPRVQVHGPGFSKILLGEDAVDAWRDHFDVMVESILSNSGRSCINCSGIWAPRHTREIAAALAERLGPIAPAPPDADGSALAAYTMPGQAEAIDAMIEARLAEPGHAEITTAHRDGARLVRAPTHAYLRPTVVHCDGPQRALANFEAMFPFASVVACPEERMVEAIGPSLVVTAITEDPAFRRQLLDATHIDRLNFGPVPTTRLDWLQPHEGNLVEFLYRARAFQVAGAAGSSR